MVVLVAEDEKKTRELIAGFLEGTGATVHTARTGLEAVRAAGELRPDVILIDGLLPELHGFEATRLIRNLDPEYKPLIVLITAIYKKRSYENEARLKWGVDRYLHKPFTREQLLAIIDQEPIVRDAAQ